MHFKTTIHVAATKSISISLSYSTFLNISNHFKFELNSIVTLLKILCLLANYYHSFKFCLAYYYLRPYHHMAEAYFASAAFS